ncbi:hypothetical protein [Wohlfahrtiimonas populi]|uniref:hypothetical protein n=1 Tax=Wohlfahrtiimonas populi TaxID=1940240 RepID=UPI00098CFEA8|nr:hypothetical protein [Wohlfahrtiimonas populi]
MNSNKKIAQKRWVYTLYKTDQSGEYIFSVAFCNQTTDFSIDYLLHIEDLSDEYLTKLANQITDSPELYEMYQV